LFNHRFLNSFICAAGFKFGRISNVTAPLAESVLVLPCGEVFDGSIETSALSIIYAGEISGEYVKASCLHV
jgi:hypothetical protein